MNPSLAGLRQFLIVFAQPSAQAQPGQRPLNHPPPGQYLEVVVGRFPAHHVQQPAPLLPKPRLPNCRCWLHRPKSPGDSETVSAVWPVPTWLHPGLGCWRHEPPRPRAVRRCPLRCGVCVRIPFCRCRSSYPQGIDNPVITPSILDAGFDQCHTPS